MYAQDNGIVRTMGETIGIVPTQLSELLMDS
jgi:hypothetical protein